LPLLAGGTGELLMDQFLLRREWDSDVIGKAVFGDSSFAKVDFSSLSYPR
jgi:hypothetical protein